MLRYCLIFLSAIIFLSSCTGILSTNIPGTPQKSFPQDWLGKYEMVPVMPGDEPVDTTKKYATIESKRITVTSADPTVSYSLDDSLRYSISGQNRYISILQPHGLYFVMKIIKTGSGFEVHMVLPDDDRDNEITKEELEKYFDKVQKIVKKDNDYYKVTINENKLDEFFKSPFAAKNYVKLVPLK